MIHEEMYKIPVGGSVLGLGASVWERYYPQECIVNIWRDEAIAIPLHVCVYTRFFSLKCLTIDAVGFNTNGGKEESAS